MKTLPNWAKQGQSQWKNTGANRPLFALEPQPGQESVWDYPRPPRIVADTRTIKIFLDDTLIAESRNAVRVLETASAPTIYIPKSDINDLLLISCAGSSSCEWKGKASYWSVNIASQIVHACAWSYENPFEEFESIQGFVSFYPSKLKCYIDKERVRPQPGGFYGGWVTSEIVGPMKGELGVIDG